MLMNIRSGRGGVTPRNNEDLVTLVSSLHTVTERKRDFVFTHILKSQLANWLTHRNLAIPVHTREGWYFS